MMSAKYFEYYTIILRGAVFSWTHCRWLYCVEFTQYSIRLEALGYLCDYLSGRGQRQQVVKVV